MHALSHRTLHVAIDMQVLFAEETAWHTPALHDILPQVVELCRSRPEHTLFARFIAPPHPDAASGRWRHFYRHHASVTGLPAGSLDLVAPLAALAGTGTVFDKTTYSVFGAPGFEARLAEAETDTLVITGVETDVCVLASALDAVDGGLRVVIPADAVGSSSADGHRAVLDHVFPRLPEQIEISDVRSVLSAWTG